jgi:hypothetical protein
LAQLTTGTIEGTSFGMDGHPLPGAAILITGGVGFRTVIHSKRYIDGRRTRHSTPHTGQRDTPPSDKPARACSRQRAQR